VTSTPQPRQEARFRDRTAAGRALARALGEYRDRADTVVLALPRGGVPVAYEVARALSLPLDVFVVRKLGVPRHPEYAMGAIASGGVTVMNPDVVAALHVLPAEVDAVRKVEGWELARRETADRSGRPSFAVRGKTVLVVDDGMATGATMRAAVEALRQRGAARIAVAVPVGAPEACRALRPLVDQVICLRTPEPFQAVGLWYDGFEQTTDDEVRDLLASSEASAA
jgi:predicted phosphoribosyltransferase